MKIAQNPDKKLVKEIRDGLKANGGYCPCVLEKTIESKCMCKEFRDMIESGKEGTCHCGLFVATKGF